MIRGSSVTNNSLETSTVSHHSMAVGTSPVLGAIGNSSSLASNIMSSATMATKRKLMNGDEGEAKADVKKVNDQSDLSSRISIILSQEYGEY